MPVLLCPSCSCQISWPKDVGEQNTIATLRSDSRQEGFLELWEEILDQSRSHSHKMQPRLFSRVAPCKHRPIPTGLLKHIHEQIKQHLQRSVSDMEADLDLVSTYSLTVS